MGIPFRENVTLAIGGENVLNTYPDVNQNGILTGGNYYGQFSPFGFNGANYYVRLNYSWGMSRPAAQRSSQDQAAPQRDPERVRQEVAEQIAELEELHDELIGHLKAIQESQTDLWLQRWAGDRVAKAQMAKERDMAMLRTNFARRAAGQDVEPLGRSAESKQLLVKDQIADLRWTYATRLSAGGVADKWVTQLLPRSSTTIESLATPAGRRRAVSPVQSTDLVPPASSPWRLKKGALHGFPRLGGGTDHR